MENDWGSQVDTVIRVLQGKKFGRDHKTYAAAMQWITNWNETGLPEAKRQSLIKTICDTFGFAEESELYAAISGFVLPPAPREQLASDEEQLERVLPKTGWFADYVEYTRSTESPLSYHVFSSLCVLGAALGRRVWKDKGFFKVWPAYVTVLIGPPARVAKTSAIDIAKGLLKEAAVCPIMADKITPEAIAKALSAERGGSGHHFIYAPEFAVFFGKQKYNEGLTTLMLRLLDQPDEWEAETITGGKVIIQNTALTVLGGSTMSLLAGATPDQVTSSGFLSRCVLVVENDTNRCFPEPQRGATYLHTRLLSTISRLTGWSGPMTFDPKAQAVYEEYYRNQRRLLREVEDETTAEILGREKVHVERTAMLVHLATCDSLTVCEGCLRVAMGLFEYVRKRVPQTVIAISQTVRTADVDYVLETIKRLGGAIDHSRLLRRVSSRMDAQSMKRNVQTLIESKLVRQERRGTLNYYILEVPDGTTQ